MDPYDQNILQFEVKDYSSPSFVSRLYWCCSTDAIFDVFFSDLTIER